MERPASVCAGCAQPLRYEDVVIAICDDTFHARCLSPAKLTTWDRLDHAWAPRTGA